MSSAITASSLVGSSGGGSAIIYDSGVLTSATQVITPSGADWTASAKKNLRISIAHRNTLGVFQEVYLYINSDTTPANYDSTLFVCDGTTTSCSKASSPLLSDTANAARALINCTAQIVDDKMLYQAWSSREAASGGDLTKITFDGKYHANTVTDLSGMTIEAESANGFGIGTRVFIIDMDQE